MTTVAAALAASGTFVPRTTVAATLRGRALCLFDTVTATDASLLRPVVATAASDTAGVKVLLHTAAVAASVAVRLVLGPDACLVAQHACAAEDTPLHGGIVARVECGSAAVGAVPYVVTPGQFHCVRTVFEQLLRGEDGDASHALPVAADEGNNEGHAAKVKALRSVFAACPVECADVASSVLLQPAAAAGPSAHTGTLGWKGAALVQALNRASHRCFQITVTETPAALDAGDAAVPVAHRFRFLRHPDDAVLPRLSDCGLASQAQLLLWEGGVVVRLRLMAPFPKDVARLMSTAVLTLPATTHTLSRRASMYGSCVGHGPDSDALAQQQNTMQSSIAEVREAMHATRADGFIAAEESRFAARLMRCAAAIQARGPRTRIVLTTGPSAAGKTTFSMRLGIALEALGYDPCVFSTDDYYRDTHEPDYPRFADGKPNHECVEALRIGRFLSDMGALLEGRDIEVPVFDFVAGQPKPEGTGRRMRLRGNGILVIEGLFALHPKLSDSLPLGSCFKIFIAPVATCFAVDALRPVPHLSLSLLRRISRDFLHRGRDAEASIARDPGVIAGAVASVLPMLHHADYFFNSCMAHELPLLKLHCAPLLARVPSGAAERVCVVAARLLELLDTIDAISDAAVPSDSLIREFVGHSVFEEAPPAPLAGSAANDDEEGSGTDAGSAALRRVAALLPHAPAKAVTIADVCAAVLGVPALSSEVVAASVDGELLPLAWPAQALVQSGCLPAVVPVTAQSELGAQVRRATLVFVLHAAAKVVRPDVTAVLTHGFGCEGTPVSCAYGVRFIRTDNNLDNSNAAEAGVDVSRVAEAVSVPEEDLRKIAAVMAELIAAKAPIAIVEVPTADALRRFRRAGMPMSEALVRSRNAPRVTVTTCGDALALFLQPLAPHAGCALQPFGLFALEDTTDEANVALTFPPYTDGSAAAVAAVADATPPLPPQTSAALRFAVGEWRTLVQRRHRLDCVGALNARIAAGKATRVAQLSDALNTVRMQSLVRRVLDDGVRVVAIGGASSSGKSTFVRGLRDAMAFAGISSASLSSDMYYRNNDDPEYPLGPDGRPDFETVEALHLAQLNADITALLEGKTVESPVFDIGPGKATGKTVRVSLRGAAAAAAAAASVTAASTDELDSDDDDGSPRQPPTSQHPAVLILEGIFAIDPAVAPMFAPSDPRKLSVLLTPLSLVNVDELRFVSNQILRTVRRVVRDYRERGRDARTSLERWGGVSRGEVRNTVPFLNTASVVLNTSEAYELGALKPALVPLLHAVSPASPAAYSSARQLLALMSWVSEFPASDLVTRVAGRR